MKRHLVTVLALIAPLSASPGWAQNRPAGGNSPASAPGSPVIGRNGPANGANVPNTGAAGSEKRLTVRVPSGGDYTAYIQEATAAAPKTFQDKGELEIPSGVKNLTIYVLDPKSGYAARKSVAAAGAPAELAFSSPDFKLVQKVRVKVTGKGDLPIAQGSVVLTDGGKNVLRKIVGPDAQGTAEFDFVVSGSGSVNVTPEGGSATTKEVTLDLPKGETAQTIPVALPEVTKTVAAPVPANGPVAPPAGNPAGAPVPQAAAPVRAAPAGDNGIGGTIIGFLFLGALLFGGYAYLKSKGLTIEDVLKKLGVQPDAVAAGGGSLAGANLATGVASPGPPPGPPPIVADPNQCPFCGQMKDAAGGCACVVARGAAAPAPGPAVGPAGGGPRLIAIGGAYMGHVFPIRGTMVIGREATNTVPLDRDNTASRRHAQITESGGTFQLQDLGSANGTYLNGARVTDSALSPNDEIGIGGTRFRFEV